MRRLHSLIVTSFLVFGCSSEGEGTTNTDGSTADGTTDGSDSGVGDGTDDGNNDDGTDVAPDVIADATTDGSTNGNDATEGEDVATADGQDVKPDVPKGPVPFETPLRRYIPAITPNNVLATVDSESLKIQLVGGSAIEGLTFADDEVPSSPVAIADGLLCWDVNANNTFDEALEDLDGNGKASFGDCDLNPLGTPAGRAGFVVSVNSPVGCVLSAVTTTGITAWTLSVTGECQKPTIVGSYALLPITTGATGVVRLVDLRDGQVATQITLPGSPTTSASFVGDGRYAIGLVGGIAAVGVATQGGTGLFLTGSADTAPERPTVIIRSGYSAMAVVTRRPEDAADSLGSRIRLFTYGANFVELPFDLETPGPMWSYPVSALVDGQWLIAAGGTGWTRVWNPSTGSTISGPASQFGTVVSLVFGGDEQLYAGEIAWNGDPELQGDYAWALWRYDPRENSTPEVLESGSYPLPLRWLGAPIMLCDIAIMQFFVDVKDVPSAYEVVKPCAGSLAAGGFARPFGDNASSGLFAPIADCATGPGVVPCSASSGCSVNTDCDDDNACTIDTCISNSCSYKFLAGCCASDEQCNDKDPCTENRCVNGKCFYPPAESCCESSSDCDDLNVCTKDECEDGTCEYAIEKTIPGCCTANIDCSTNLPCATGICNEQFNCEILYTPNCCNQDKDCDDGLKCTLDLCEDGTCTQTPNPEEFGCCGDDADCATGNICIAGACDITTATCTVNPIDGCCLTNVQCNDKQLCTKDICEQNVCKYEADVAPKGCCDDKADCVVELTACILGYDCNVAKNECQNETKDCDDDDDCTLDACKNGECVHTPVPSCCLVDEDCEDGDPCTVNTCDQDFNTCSEAPAGGCCNITSDCADTDPASTEQCIGNVCVLSRCDIYPYLTTDKPLDLVFVVDQSTSMNDEIPLVRKYMNDLAAWIGTAGVDYHVTLIASRSKTSSNTLCVEPPLAGPNCENAERFRQIDIQVSSHNALGLVIDEIATVESFMRAGSTRQVVVVSDDTSNTSAAAFAFFVSARPGWDDWALHAFVGVDGKTCALEAGQDYLDLAALTGGLTYDICDQSWISTYDDLGKVGATAGTSFTLPAPPLVGTLTVTYDGVKKTEGSEWTYSSDSNRVTWSEPPPPVGKVLQICLDYNAAPTN